MDLGILVFGLLTAVFRLVLWLRTVSGVLVVW